MRTTTIILALAVVLAVTAGAAAPAFAQAAPPSTTAKPAEQDSGWDVIVYPVLAYIPVAGINITLPPAPPCPGCGDSIPTANGDSGLSGAAFADLRVEKGRVAIEANVNYAGLQAERSTPFLNLEVKVITGSITGGFKIVEGLYAEAGARYHELDVTATLQTYPAATWKPNDWRPLIGTTFRPDLTKRIRLFTHLDYTGFGGDALSSVNGQARIELRPIKHLLLTAGYGFSHLIANGEVRSKPIHLDYTLHGPILGIGIPF